MCDSQQEVDADTAESRAVGFGVVGCAIRHQWADPPRPPIDGPAGVEGVEYWGVRNRQTGEVIEHTGYDEIFRKLKRELTKRVKANQ